MSGSIGQISNSVQSLITPEMMERITSAVDSGDHFSALAGVQEMLQHLADHAPVPDATSPVTVDVAPTQATPDAAPIEATPALDANPLTHFSETAFPQASPEVLGQLNHATEQLLQALQERQDAQEHAQLDAHPDAGGASGVVAAAADSDGGWFTHSHAQPDHADTHVTAEADHTADTSTTQGHSGDAGSAGHGGATDSGSETPP